MKTDTIKTKQVYSENKQNTVILKEKEEEWFPINFQWIPVLKLNIQMNLKTNKMKNLFILPLLLLLIFMSSCSKETINGSGDLTSEYRTVAAFSKVDSEGVFDVIIRQGSTQTLEITADDNIIQEIKTDVVNNELRLYLDDDNNYRHITSKINIVIPSINHIKNSGVGNISIFDIDINDDFDVDNSGTGDIYIEGNAQSLNIKNEGSGKFEGFLFAVDDCNVNLIGTGDCKINCSNNLNVTIEGSGDVYYLGTPIIETDITGSGKIVNSN